MSELNQCDQSIIARKEMKRYISQKKDMYEILMKFLDNSDNNENYLQDLINIIHQQMQEEKRDELEEFLRLLTNIATTSTTLSNIEIFHIFESNKKEIITVDDNIYIELLSKTEENGNRYYHFFYPEIKKFVGEEKVKDIEKELFEKYPDVLDFFDEKRQEGENDSFICSLIREDSVEKFVEYVNQLSISLNSEVKPSLFEKKSFLIENKNTTLIEYAVFFGSFHIFQYLKFNNVDLKQSLWLYAIHSRNAEMIDLFESCKIDPPSQKYEKCLCESIKCHHNEIADYFENIILSQKNDKINKNEDILSCILKYHNYAFFPLDFDNGDDLFYLCSCNYHKIVKLFMKMKKQYLEKTISEITLEEAVNKNKVEIIY